MSFRSPDRAPTALFLSSSILALTGLLAATRIGDPDTMQYLASGRLMLQRGLDYGCAFNHPSDTCQVVFSQWLVHLLAYGTYVLGGFPGLVVLQVLVALSVFALVLARRGMKGVHPLVTGAVMLLAILVARERFSFRADFFALLPAVLLYFVLDAHAAGGRSFSSRRWLLAAAAGVQMLWANIHGSFPIGILLAGAFVGEAMWTSVLEETGRARRGEPRGISVASALAIFTAILAASFLNPFGPKAFLQPFRFMLAGKDIAPQLEFLSPFAPADLQQLTFTAYKVLLAVLGISLVLSIRSLRLRDVLVLAPMVYLSVNGVRYLALFAVFCAILLPPYLEDLRTSVAVRLSERGRRIAAVATAALLAGAIIGIGHAAATDRLYRFDSISRRTGFGLSELFFPIAAADFVERNDLPGNMFNDYSVGTFLNWRLFPARRTFIDGHSYTPETLANYTRLMSRGAAYEAMAEAHDVRYFFLSHKSADTRSLIASLHRSKGWAHVYFDELAMIYVKRSPENESLIERSGIDLARVPVDGSVPPANIRSPEDSYLGHTNRAIVFSGLGLDEQAIAELRLAVKESPTSFVSLTLLGIHLGKKGDVEGAVAVLQQAVRARPGYAPAHFWLGTTYLQLKRYPEVVAQLKKALAINPRMGLANFRLGEAYEALGDHEAARARYTKELEISPRHPGALERLGTVGN